jgi:hypothetical protein
VEPTNRVLVEQDGFIRRLPVIDLTRLLQVLHLGLAIVAGWAFLSERRRKPGRP